MTERPARPRGRRLLAIAAVVLGAVVLVKQLTTGTDGAASTAQHRVDAVAEPQQLEKSFTPEPKAASGQATTAPASHLPPVAETAPPAPVTADPAPHSLPALASPADGVARIEAAPPPLPPRREDDVGAPPARMNVEASTKEGIPGLVVAPLRPAPVPSASASAKEVAPVPRAGMNPAPVVAGSAGGPVAPRPAAPPRPAVGGATATPGWESNVPVAPTPRAPRPFDESLATQQFEAAVAKAAACSQAGPTRGSGRVKVAIEPWGRVGRITHLNQDFVGTQVGSCVTEAFQQIKIPPFDGNSRAIAGDFIVQ
jgi:hypothetical protein